MASLGEETMHNPKGGEEDEKLAGMYLRGVSIANTSSDTRGTSSSTSNKRELPAQSPNPAKRRRVEKSEADGDDEDGTNHEDKSSGLGAENKRRLACPFFKRKPTKTRPSCVYPGFSTIARLKEHLYRQHMMHPHLCSRCLQKFKTDADLREHARATIPCEINEGATPEGITTEQEKALKSKKRTSKSGTINNEEDKWRDVYAILFPGESIPSPYCDPMSTPTIYEDFLRKELPSLVKTHLYNLDKKLDTSEDQSRDQIASIVGECQDEIFAQWHRNTTSAANKHPSSSVSEARSKSPPLRSTPQEDFSHKATNHVNYEVMKAENTSPS